jgi:hypothetical protein
MAAEFKMAAKLMPLKLQLIIEIIFFSKKQTAWIYSKWLKFGQNQILQFFHICREILENKI